MVARNLRVAGGEIRRPLTSTGYSMNVTAAARPTHRFLTAFLVALALWPMLSVSAADAAVYVVKQCNPATTYEHDWFAPTDRPDAFWAEARCWESSLNLS